MQKIFKCGHIWLLTFCVELVCFVGVSWRNELLPSTRVVSKYVYFYLAQLKTVHTALWPHCPNKNVFSNRLNRPYDTPQSDIGQQTVRDLWSCGGKGPVFKTAACPTDNECWSVGRTQLSDTGIGGERTVVGQVTRWTRVAILNTTRCRTGSQCSWWSTGEI